MDEIPDDVIVHDALGDADFEVSATCDEKEQIEYLKQVITKFKAAETEHEMAMKAANETICDLRLWARSLEKAFWGDGVKPMDRAASQIRDGVPDTRYENTRVPDTRYENTRIPDASVDGIRELVCETTESEAAMSYTIKNAGADSATRMVPEPSSEGSPAGSACTPTVFARLSRNATVRVKSVQPNWRSQRSGVELRDSAEFGLNATLRLPGLDQSGQAESDRSEKNALKRMLDQSQQHVHILEAESCFWEKEEHLLHKKLSSFHAYVNDVRGEMKGFKMPNDHVWEAMERLTTGWDRFYVDFGKRVRRLEQKAKEGALLEAKLLNQSFYGLPKRERQGLDALLKSAGISTNSDADAGNISPWQNACTSSQDGCRPMSSQGKIFRSSSSPQEEMWRNSLGRDSIVTPQGRCFALDPIGGTPTAEEHRLRLGERTDGTAELKKRRLAGKRRLSTHGSIPELPAIT